MENQDHLQAGFASDFRSLAEASHTQTYSATIAGSADGEGKQERVTFTGLSPIQMELFWQVFQNGRARDFWVDSWSGDEVPGVRNIALGVLQRDIIAVALEGMLERSGVEEEPFMNDEIRQVLDKVRFGRRK